jgi:kumamolisin
VTLFVASGDTGADGCGNGGKTANWPGSHPHVVSVGGTSFHLDPNGILNESAWKGSGGGLSSLYLLPSYQKGLNPNFTMRAYPDVAFNADPKTGPRAWIHRESDQGHWVVVGGTSAAAPEWAAFAALAAEARSKLNRAPLGFLNPMLYSMPSEMKLKTFHDIEHGNNGYDAGMGWDPVTGHGSMKADKLLDYLNGL